MNLGDILLLLGALGSFFSMLLRLISLKSEKKEHVSYSAMFSIVTFAVLSIALFYLAALFLTSDMSISYVWQYSSRDLDPLYKLSGVWAGASGSFLLWIWMMSLALTVEVLLEGRRKYLSQKFCGIFQVSLSLVIFVFILMLLAMNLFAPTVASANDAWKLTYYPDGWGMSFLLQTPEMAIHPPVIFAAYAFAICVLGASVAYQLTGQRNWHMLSLPWARYSWLFLTAGIGIGAIWAYYVIGWGGYWAWDPVETSSIFPWLILTAFLHTQLRYSSKGEYRTLSPILGVATFLTVLFATFVTRAGGIWSQSVHTFEGATGDSALSRFLYLLGNDPVVLGIFLLMMLLIAFLAFQIYTGYHKGEDEAESPKTISEYISDRNNMTLTVILLIFTTVVGLLILLKNTDTAQLANYEEFNQKMSIFFVALMITMNLCLIWKFIGKKRAFILALVLISASIIFALVFSASALVAFSLPSYICALIVSIIKIGKLKIGRSARLFLKNIGPQLIHLGVALILISFIVSTNLQTVSSYGEYVNLDLGGQMTIGDYSIRLVDLDSHELHAVGGGSIVEEERVAVIEIYKGGQLVESDVTLTNLFGFHNFRYEKLTGNVIVYKTAINDLYLSFDWRNSTSAIIQAKILPMMNTLWIGFSLLIIGIISRTLGWKTEPYSIDQEMKKPPEAGRKSRERQAKDYEAIVEEELKRLKESRKKD